MGEIHARGRRTEQVSFLPTSQPLLHSQSPFRVPGDFPLGARGECTRPYPVAMDGRAWGCRWVMGSGCSTHDPLALYDALLDCVDSRCDTSFYSPVGLRNYGT